MGKVEAIYSVLYFSYISLIQNVLYFCIFLKKIELTPCFSGANTVGT